MTERVEAAMQMADRCWGRAYRVAPAFAWKYFQLAEQLLMKQPIVTSDEMKQYCADHQLHRPKELHSNVWQQAMFCLQQMRWIQPTRKKDVWESKLYKEKDDA